MKRIDVASVQQRLEKALQTRGATAGGLNYDLMYVRQVYLGMSRYFDLSPSEAMLLALVHTLSRDGKAWCYMGQKGLGSALNVAPQTAGEIVGRLEEKGLLEPGPKHPRWNTNQWRLSPKALDHLKYTQEQIARQKYRRDGYQNHYQ